ncbi:hypothetical protein [Neobacillus sp. 204]|uniref:hypothetical protein n=1 Tax=Neobacillus sp. 204 TaxID=3383351 RepID=UPI00397C6AE5
MPCFQDLVLKQHIKERITQIQEKHSISESTENYYEIEDMFQSFVDHGLPAPDELQKTLR